MPLKVNSVVLLLHMLSRVRGWQSRTDESKVVVLSGVVMAT
jgi:hypothetical protein